MFWRLPLMYEFRLVSVGAGVRRLLKWLERRHPIVYLMRVFV